MEVYNKQPLARPEAKLPDKQQHERSMKRGAAFPCNHDLSLRVLFSNQFTNLEMASGAGFRPLQALDSLYWTVNQNWKPGSARLIDFRPQKPNDVLAERNLSKDINNYEP